MTTSTFPGAADNDANLIRRITGDAMVLADHNNLVDAIEAIEGNLLSGGAGTTKFYRQDNTFAVPAGGGGGLAELAYQEFNALVNCVGTTEATATVIVTLPSIAYPGTPVALEFFSPVAQDVGGEGVFVLHDDTAGVSLGFLGEINGVTSVVSFLKRRFTPVAGARVYSVRGWSVSGSMIVQGGAGGAGAFCPGFIRVVG